MRHISVPFFIITMAMVFSACSRTSPLQTGDGQTAASGASQQATAVAPGAPPLSTTSLSLPTIPVQNATDTGLLGQGGAPGAATAGSYSSPLGGINQQAPTNATTAEIVTTTQTTTVKRGNIEDVLTLAGQVAPVQYNLTFAQDGIIKEVYVQAGQSVSKGELLAELDLGELSGQLSQAKLDLQQSQSALSRQVQAGKLAIDQAQLDIDAARDALTKAKAPASALDIATAQVNLREAQASLDTVKNNASQIKNQAKETLEQVVSDLQQLQKQRDEITEKLKNLKRGSEAALELQDELVQLDVQISAAQTVVDKAIIDYDTARNNEVAAVQDAEAKRDLAQATLDSLLRGSTIFEIAEKERAVRRAELQLAQVQQAAAADPDLVKAVDANHLQISEIESQISTHRLYAPFDGDIAVVNATPSLPIQVGTSVMTLVDDSRMEIIATVDGTRTTQPRINPGQPVQLTFSRYSNQTFSGSITYAPNLADVNNVDSSYHITFDAKGRLLSVGDVADVQVTLGRKYDALWLPIAAVHFTRDRPYVFVSNGGESKRTDVVTGIITADRVEIISGLKEGEVVTLQ